MFRDKIMKYKYKEALNEKVASDVKFLMKTYNFAIELSRIPEGFSKWALEHMPKYNLGNDGEWAPDRYSYLCASVHKSACLEDGVFFFVKTKSEKNLICEKYADLVVDTQPFQTLIF